MSATRDWDAGTYDRVSSPQVGWAGPVLDRLDPRRGERALDAGCGSGRVTELLADRVLPGGSVLAVDGSASMAAAAESRFSGERWGGLVEVRHADLLELELTPEERVDAVFSTATFHWILDHGRLFERVHSWLRPGGRIEAQCGGEGNVARFFAIADGVGREEPFARYLAEMGESRRFAGPEETAALLEAAGFEEIECRLQPAPTDPPEPRNFAETVCLGVHLERLPADLRESYLDRVVERWGCEASHRLDYVRLNISARRPVQG